MKMTDYDELVIRGIGKKGGNEKGPVIKRFPRSKWFNPDYIEARNAFIPDAEAYADKVCGEKLPKQKKNDAEREEWNNCWNLAFHSKMNELARTI